MQGTIFDIKEFAVHDGDGIRTTVFMKGCPLRCIWCHNPEGLSPSPELYIKQNGCRKCGLCHRECEHPDCKSYGRCLHVCPSDLVSVVGKSYSVQELAKILLEKKDALNALGGGITISGGEPLMQWEFVRELLSLLKGKLNRCIETSGYAPNKVFKSVAKECDKIIMDIKIADANMHKMHTGVDNITIIENLKWLKNSGIPHLFRTPLIPGITDTHENLLSISELIGDDKIELLPYNTLAPAKYASVGKSFMFEYDQSLCTVPDLTIFKNAIIRK